MPFPPTDRVLYEHNPLEQVICQLIFPTILRIESEPPSRFQDKVRSRYPLFTQPQALTVPALPQELTKLVGALMPVSPPRIYEFGSPEGKWKLTLSKDFIALVSFRYERWEEFVDHLTQAVRALKEEYSPAFFVRTGLRYRNVIRRSELDLDQVPWSELLQPHIAAEFGTTIVKEIVSASHQIVIRLDDGRGKVTIQHGTGQLADTAEECYVIDNDFYSEERTTIENAANKLDYFHAQSGRLFQWCIRPKLHDAMRPKTIR